MTNAVKDLEISQKDALIIALQKQNEEQSRIIEELRFQLEQFRKLVYGAKRERFVSSNNLSQGTLFDREDIDSQSVESTSSVEQESKAKKSGKQNKRASRLSEINSLLI